jgi:hypothetical protein
MLGTSIRRFVELPSGRRLRPAIRQLTAGGVAAGAKLQRLLGRLQLGAAAAEVVRTAAALALQRVQDSLLLLQEGPLEAPGITGTSRATAATSSPTSSRPPQPASPTRPAPPAAASSWPAAGRPALGQRRPGAVSLVWCGEARVTLCLPQQSLVAALAEVQAAASAGVMGHLGLRVPLHVSIYHGSGLDLLHCQQYIPGGGGAGALAQDGEN